MKRLLQFLILTMALATSLQAYAAEPGPPEPTAKLQLESHPLINKVWSREKAALMDVQDLNPLLQQWRSNAAILLLGEVHDNPIHHELQSTFLSQYIAANTTARPTRGGGTVIFEMIGSDQQAALDTHLADIPVTDNDPDAHVRAIGAKTDTLGEVVQWEQRGWPSWRQYQPLAQRALLGGFRIVGGDAPLATFTAIARQGEAGLGDERLKILGLDAPLSSAEQAALTNSLFESHCRMVPREKLGNMSVSQRYRDAHLADRILASPEPRVLIAGNGHVRNSGVPRYLHARGVAAERTVSIQLVEVEDGVNDPLSLIPRDANGKVDGDFFVFTPSVERGDPCEAFKNHMKRKPE